VLRDRRGLKVSLDPLDLRALQDLKVPPASLDLRVQLDHKVLLELQDLKALLDRPVRQGHRERPVFKALLDLRARQDLKA
jgi:hypothetical protein